MMIKKLIVLQLVVMTCSLKMETTEKEEVLIPKCPANKGSEENADNFCVCSTHFVTPSRGTASVKCTFNGTQNVLIDESLYPFRNMSLGSAYVRIVNASKVHVSKAFLGELMQSPSIALDIWGAGTLLLDSMPDPESDKFKSYKTFMGVGISDCFVPEIPKYFLRDRTRGGFRLVKSRVGNFHEGVLHNMDEMRYLVFQDSTIDFFEGSVATEGYVTLSKRQLHNWNGLYLSNVTIDTISSGTFNLTHKSDMESAEIIDSRIGSLNKEAIVVAGDIDVSIKNNIFMRIEKEAIKVAVTGDVSFNKNDIASWEPDALEGIICHKRTSLEENTFHVNDPTDIALNISSTPFHASCGIPQLFLVIKPQHPLTIIVSTTSSWILGVVFVLLVLSIVVVGVSSYKRQNLLMHFYKNPARMPLSGLRERKLSQENLPNGAEIDPAAEEAAEDGVTNPTYVDVHERL